MRFALGEEIELTVVIAKLTALNHWLSANFLQQKEYSLPDSLDSTVKRCNLVRHTQIHVWHTCPWDVQGNPRTISIDDLQLEDNTPLFEAGDSSRSA